MKAYEKLRQALRMSEADMAEWVGLFQNHVSWIRPEENRLRRLEEIRNDATTYFTAEMDARFRDESPLTYKQIQALVDKLFQEMGVKGLSPRDKGIDR